MTKPTDEREPTTEQIASAIRVWLLWRFIEACNDADLDWREEIAKIHRAVRR